MFAKYIKESLEQYVVDRTSLRPTGLYVALRFTGILNGNELIKKVILTWFCVHFASHLVYLSEEIQQTRAFSSSCPLVYIPWPKFLTHRFYLQLLPRDGAFWQLIVNWQVLELFVANLFPPMPWNACYWRCVDVCLCFWWPSSFCNWIRRWK